MGIKVDEYKFMCWLMDKVPSGRHIRNLFRLERAEKREGGEKKCSIKI